MAADPERLGELELGARHGHLSTSSTWEVELVDDDFRRWLRIRDPGASAFDQTVSATA
jgi:hypothetical protein